MLLNEIEIASSSFGFRRYNLKSELPIPELAEAILNKADMFNMESELPGMHDIDYDDMAIRGFYSMIVPFEVSHLVDGIMTKTLLKRIDSCEFIITGKILIVFGDGSCCKCFATALSAVTGCHVEVADYDYQRLFRLQERLQSVKSIALLNPKEMAVRKAKLSGNIEHYTEFNVVDARNHGIENVAGMIDTPFGPMKITASHNGRITLGVRKGLIMTIEGLEWILALVENESVPAMEPALQSIF